jgi:hypothetical protein
MVTTRIKYIGIEDLLDPSPEKEGDEEEAGIANDEIKKMYTLRELCNRNSDELMLSAKYERNKDKQLQLLLKAGNYKNLSNLWNSMLWQAVYKQFPEVMNKARTAIRRGFVVVWSEKPEAHNDIFRQLFGGGFPPNCI